MNRKDFLKRFGTGIGVSVIMPALLKGEDPVEDCDKPDSVCKVDDGRIERLIFTKPRPWGENIAKSTPVVINMSAWTEHSN